MFADEPRPSPEPVLRRRAAAGRTAASTPPRGLHAALSHRRRALRHSHLLRRLVRRRSAALLVAVAVAVLVASTLQDARERRERWGATASVLVARQDLDAGAEVSAASFAEQRWPAELIADAALSRLPTQGRLTEDLGRGELLTEHRLAPAGRGPGAARLRPGEVAVATPVGEVTVAVQTGDLVDVVAPAAAGTALDGLDDVAVTGRTVATAARVLEVNDSTLTLAVRSSQAERTAAAALGGLVAVLVVG